jgi:ATP-dependent RNA helicase SUPV3L1/SUV3
MSPPSSRAVTAVLGPTNTGKTYLAVERMLAHESGMIGLPLRLLAREVYDRIRLKTGDPAVALVTGEEKIVPKAPRYWVCTVEAMPSDVAVAFLAIDEIQMAADLERGHVFSDRVLTRRGREETMLLGAATMRPILETVLPGINVVTRPRFSRLSYSGQKKISRLPRRSAIVAFSAGTVYAIAEIVRRQRGGAAVVLGALSPRTRNAQVALYQSGDVDYLVATDAIGMGLNMDVDHIAFAATRKFDGFAYRDLSAAELAQVAGRAGRYLNDGTFGLTGEAKPFDDETVRRLENHDFEPVRILQWRNRDLSYASIEALKASLNELPPHRSFVRARSAADVLALEQVSEEPDIADFATTPGDVELLWDVCQIPDYRNISNAEHAGIVSRIFRFLRSGNGQIPTDWFARQLSYCDRLDGDIDTISNRISHIRTWTFVANRNWLADPVHWRARTREIEDRLSDALHESLTQRFIDRRTSVLMKRMLESDELVSTVEDDGAITVEGEFVGRMLGLRFVPADAGEDAHQRTLRAASVKSVAQELEARAQAIAAAPDPDIGLSRDGHVIWQSAPIARLEGGAELLKPRIELLVEGDLSVGERAAVQLRIERWLSRHVAALLEPLVALSEDESIAGLARGVAFRLVEQLGVIPRDHIAGDVKALGQEERARLRKHGVRFGAFHIFIPALLKPAASQLRLLLWALSLERAGILSRSAIPETPGQGLTSLPFDPATPKGFYRIAGFRICGRRCVRIDMLERLGDLIRDRVFWRPRLAEEARPHGSIEGGGFSVVADMMSLVGCSGEEFAEILRSLGFRMERRSRTSVPPPAETSPAPVDPASGSLISPAVSDPAVHAPTSEVPVVAATSADIAAAPPSADGGDVLEVWWPRDTGPFRRRPKPARKEKSPKSGPERPGAVERKAGTPRRGPAKPKSRPPAREPAVDPLSPFAVLGGLRAQLSSNKKNA